MVASLSTRLSAAMYARYFLSISDTPVGGRLPDDLCADLGFGGCDTRDRKDNKLCALVIEKRVGARVLVSCPVRWASQYGEPERCKHPGGWISWGTPGFQKPDAMAVNERKVQVLGALYVLTPHRDAFLKMSVADLSNYDQSGWPSAREVAEKAGALEEMDAVRVRLNKAVKMRYAYRTPRRVEGPVSTSHRYLIRPRGKEWLRWAHAQGLLKGSSLT